ncbi:MAG: CbiX/SirB N-terminal domain-containing protein [Candidatus Omnitrophica bacterium]|nr:CbiX/SirB N-terminal domain-containing protein [Candidatus Omnitrophota bacterium]
MRAILLLSHGSKSLASQAEVAELGRRIAREGECAYVQHAYLDTAEPLFTNALETLIVRGATQIVVVLHFLNTGNHVTRDIPELLEQARKKYPEIVFYVTRPVGLHPVIPALCSDLIREVLTTPAQPGENHG